MAGKQVIYQLDDRTTYLLPTIARDAVILAAQLPDSSPRVLDLIPPDASRFIFHLDLTVTAHVPTDRAAFLRTLDESGLKVWNARPIDISKRRVQAVLTRHGLNTTLLVQNSDYDGLVIVKNNGNFGAVTERAMSRELRRRLGIRDVCTNFLKADQYYVCRRAEISDELWLRQDVAIERYISNSINVFYRMYACGSAIVLSRVRDPATLKKMPPGIIRENAFFWQSGLSAGVVRADFEPYQQVANEAIAARIAIGLDFGALDIVCNSEGTAFVVDVNTTPFWGLTGCPEIIQFLFNGIDS